MIAFLVRSILAAWLVCGLAGVRAGAAEVGSPPRPAVAVPAAPTVPPGVSNVLQRAATALGTPAVVGRARTLRARGTAEAAHLGAAIPCELLAEAPACRSLSFQLSGQRRVREVVDGDRAWSEDPDFGRTDATGEDLARRRRDATFLRELHLARLYPDLRWRGVEPVEGESCDVLESRPAPETSERFAFSRQTGRLIRQESRFEGALGPAFRAVTFADHRPVDGLLFPHRIQYRQRGGSQAEPEVTIEVRFHEVKFNVPLPEGSFGRPAKP
jgi:hypothetical protein